MTEGTTSNTEAALPSTEMIYYSYDGNFEMECSSRILQITEADRDDNVVEVVLDRTVLHAQGGGQPTDIGNLKVTQGNDAAPIDIAITKVLIDRATGVATHRGTLAKNNDSDELFCLPVGAPVHVSVNPDNRRILSECHTAGHCVDAAMLKCGKVMKPTKGYHFLEGPYVEYEGSIPPEERDQVLKDLQAAFQELVEEDIPTKIEILSEQEASDVCNRIAKNFDMKDFGGGKEEPTDIRVVTVAGFPCPCGGTHVKSTGDLKERKWGIIGLKSKKGVVRVRYGQEKQ